MGRAPDVLVGQFGAAHGIKGEVRLKSFTARPQDVGNYGPLTGDNGAKYEIETARMAAGTSPDMLVVRVKGVRDRNAAETLNGIRLSMPQERLPPAEEGEYYHADLIGLSAVTAGGDSLGTIVGVPNYGAGDLLEIAPKRGATILVPFTDAAVPEVDVAGGRVVVVPPVFDTDVPESGDAESGGGGEP